MGLDYHGPYVPTGRGDLRWAVGCLLGAGRMIDQFLWFCLPEEDKRFLEPYRSPETETSVFKWIPVAEKPRTRDLCLKLGLRVRVVYRGPRKRWAAHTAQEDATHFTVYPIG